MPSRELGERYPGLIAIGGHPSVDMPPHVVEAAAQAAEACRLRADAGPGGVARGDRGRRRGRARTPDRSRPGGADHARRDAGPLPGGAGLRRAVGHARPVVLLPAGHRGGRRDLRRDRRRRRGAGLGGIRSGDRAGDDARGREHAGEPDRLRLPPARSRSDRGRARRQRCAAPLRRGVRRRPLRRPPPPLTGVASRAGRPHARPAELLEDPRDGGVADRLRRRPGRGDRPDDGRLPVAGARDRRRRPGRGSRRLDGPAGLDRGGRRRAGRDAAARDRRGERDRHDARRAPGGLRLHLGGRRGRGRAERPPRPRHGITALPGRHFAAATPHLRIPFGGRSEAREALLEQLALV